MSSWSYTVVVFCVFGNTEAIQWPDENYALPMSVYGCPDSSANDWKYGYLNITFNNTLTLFEHYRGSAGRNESELSLIELLGPYGPYSIQLNFCGRVKGRDNNVAVWPSGQYGIYGTNPNKSCPLGFTTSLVSLSLPTVLFANRDGFIPDINITHNFNMSGSGSTIRFRKCQRNVTDEDQEFSRDDLDLSTILLAHDELNSNDNDTITLNHLYIDMVWAGRETRTRYDLIRYYTVKPKEQSLNIEDPDFLERYTKTATVLYAPEVRYSKGQRINGLSGYTHEDTWILYDVGIGAVINGVTILGEFTVFNFQQKLGVIPQVYVSEMKWSFLDNGAQRCITDVYTSYSTYNIGVTSDWILIQCLNKPVGRFISLVFSREMESIDLRSLFNSVRIVQFITKEKSPRCSRPLGMISGAILDVQLSASSSKLPTTTPERARPKQMGWCADYSDMTPYYQIDFVATVRVEGIQLYKIQVINSYYVGYGELFSFSVAYGANSSALKRLSQEVTLQLQPSTTNVQTVLFASTLKTRYFRLYPKKPYMAQSTVCLEFEVIGCQIPDPLQRDCKANTNRQWFPVKDLSIPHQPTDPVNTSFTSKSCLGRCDSLPLCYGVSFNSSNGECELFLQSPTYSYRHESYSGNSSKAFVKLCDTDEYLEARSGYISSFNELYWGDKTRENPGILVSPGYPLYYPRAAVLLWTINVDEGQYVNLLFSNLSLNKHKQSTQDSESGCEDTIYLYPYHLNTSDSLFRVTQHIEYGTFLHHPHDSLPMVLTRDMNRQQFVYNSYSSSITVVLRTCHDEKMSNGEDGHGFRLLAYASDYSTCLHWGFHVTDQETGCYGQKAEIASMSFAGFFFEKSEFNLWSIIVDRLAYIILEITEFDVGCETGTIFEITNVEIATRYCNQQRPVYPIVSDSNRLQLKFHVRLCGSIELVEGFKARYTSAIKNEYVMTLASSDEYDSETFKQLSVTVCSDTFNKCYVMLDLEKFIKRMPNVTAAGWNYTAKFICGNQGWHLVSLHSKTEQDFVSYYLQHRLQSRRHFRNSTGYYGYAYLGLMRKSDKYMWSDGSPVTYTSWAPGHPSRHSESACTRLSIRSSSADITWEAVSCGYMMADYAVCEYPVELQNTTTDTGETDVMHPTQISHPIEHGFEMSVYFDCGDGEIISLLGRCDGSKDCRSGVDEEYCDTGNNSTQCSLDQFRCNNGKCLDISLLCDFHYDCQGGEDEACEFPDCLAGKFRCKSNECIPGSLRCDGKPDCWTGEDELSCSSCNSATSFSCGDYSCIPLSYRCDGVPDCQTELDEKYCTTAIPNTCQEWYNAGYRDSGMYTVYGEDMECNFDELASTGKIVTKYHSIDFLTEERKRAIGQLYLQYGSEAVLKTLSEEHECFQSVDQLCQPWIQDLYEVDQNGTGGQNSRCDCLRWTHSLGVGNSYYESCDGSNATRRPLLKVHSLSKPYIERLDIDTYYFSSDDFSNTRIRINPVVCYADFKTPPPDIVCGNGMTAPAETKCRYDKTDYGLIHGCRNLAHLQNCESYDCPEGFFKCSSSFCLESRFVCDGEKHCEHGEDELNCGVSTRVCYNQYRCLHTNICLSLDYLCDGFRQCPLGDDERFCNFSCPRGCRCKGLAVDCRTAEQTDNEISLSENVRLIDTSSNSDFFSFISLKSKNLVYLSFLNMSFCNVSEIQGEFFVSMGNLLVLDMSYNYLKYIRSEMFINQKKLNHLFLAGNAEIHTIEPRAFAGLHSLKHFELKYVHVNYLSKDAFHSLDLETIDLSFNTFDSVDDEIFKDVKVDDLYLNGTKVKRFREGMFQGMKIKNMLITEAYKFCCIKPSSLPEENCYPHKNEFSSCSDLMRNDALRALLWIIGLFSLLGNGASLIYRFIYDRERLKMGYGIFVSNLAAADFLMGVYLIIIASADVAFRGTYIYKDETWRYSIWCKLAGIFSTVSSEASVLFICLITLDRIFVIKYPFGQIRFTTVSAVVSSCIVWVIVCVIGILPVAITSYFKGTFYSKSGVCLALPLTRDRPPGWVYSISIFIGFNFITFLAIAFGQWMIYTTINKARSRMKSFSTNRSNDLRVARNLLFVASTDFLCWFPIGILGILALSNHAIPGEVYAWTAVLVLPINSALNPFLYTLSAILGRAKFQPDTSEQTRTQVTSLDVIVRHYDVWNCKLFVQPSLAKCLLPLTAYLKQKDLRISRMLCTAVTIARCIEFLHDRDVSTLDLTLDNLYMRPSSKGTFSVVLSFKPKMVQKDSEKQEDINKYGKLLDSILKRCNISTVKAV